MWSVKLRKVHGTEFAVPNEVMKRPHSSRLSSSKKLTNLLFARNISMDGLSVEDSVTNKIVKQLTEDFETICSTLEYYQQERSSIVKAQNLALAAYDYEIKEIEGGLDADNV